MKKISFYLVLAAFVMGMNACKKDSSVNPAVKIKTATTGSTVTTYNYDASGRIARITVSGITGYTSYEYKGSDSIIVYLFNGTDSVRSSYYVIGAGGYATSSTSTVMFGGTSTYTYDANGYRIRTASTGFLSSSGDTSTINGSGNVTVKKRGYSGIANSENAVATYTYNTDENTLSYDAMGQSFLGKSNTNLLSSSTETGVNSSSGAFTTPLTFTYEFDGDGRVTKMTQTNSLSSATTVTTYTYY